MPAASPPHRCCADLNTAYTANDNGSISGLSNEDVTLSDTTLDVSTLNTLDGNTSGTIDASNIITSTGAAADLNTAYTANDNGSISGLSNEDVTLSDTTLDVSILNTLDGNTAGTIDASSITTLTGAAADLNTAYDSNGISGLGDEAVNVSSGTATTDQANTLATATSAVVTATLSDGDMATLSMAKPPSQSSGNRQRLLHHHHGHLSVMTQQRSTPSMAKPPLPSMPPTSPPSPVLLQTSTPPTTANGIGSGLG